LLQYPINTASSTQSVDEALLIGKGSSRFFYGRAQLFQHPCVLPL
jgi:hypothetical protein